MTAKETEFNGHPMLELGEIYGKPFSMGATKLRLVMNNIEAVKAFLAKHPETAKADKTKATNVVLSF